MTSKLYYFVHSYPFDQTWNATELNILRTRFDEIVVVPYCREADPGRDVEVPEGVRVTAPLFDDLGVIHPRELLSAAFEGNLLHFTREFFAGRVWERGSHFDKWLIASLRIRALRRHPTIRALMRDSNDLTAWYFYWGRGSCDIVPFLGRCRRSKTLVRMHGYDLFEHRNSGYIPYRRPLLDNATIVAPSSKAGVAHLHERHPDARATIMHLPCGTIGSGRSRPSGDGVTRLVSCSSLIPLKRVELIAHALRLTPARVHWTHLGDGPLMPDLQQLAASLPSHVSCDFMGYVPPRSVLPFYLSHPADLFINVSSSEGVPFSIMEALSAGIPVFATAVGGTPEIVDDAVGRLLPAEVTPQSLSDAIAEFWGRGPVEREKVRAAAFARYASRCDARVLTERLATILTGEERSRRTA